MTGEVTSVSLLAGMIGLVPPLSAAIVRRIARLSGLEKRDAQNTAMFIQNVRESISRKRFQISSDGWEPYESAIEAGLSDVASYGRIVKVVPPGRVEAVFGNLDIGKIETTYVERFNRTLTGLRLLILRACCLLRHR